MFDRMLAPLQIFVYQFTVVAAVLHAPPACIHRVYNLSTPRGAMVAANINDSIVCFGGGSIAGSPKGSPPSDIVECLVAETGAPLPITHLPHQRAGDSTTGGWLSAVNAAFFGAGGGDSGSVDLLTRSNDGNWEWLPSLRTALIHEFTACAGIGSVVACAGGQGHEKDDKNIPQATDVFQIGSPPESHVRHLTDYRLSQPRKKLSAAAQGDAIVFAMGYSDTEPKGKGYSDAWDMLNTSTLEWSSGKLPSGIGRQYSTAVGCGGVILFGGGQVGGGRSNAVDLFDTRTKKWSNSTLSVARSNLGAACAANRWAIFAGGQIPGRATVDAYDTVSGQWSVLPDLNYGRGWVTGASAGRCAVFGGGDQQGNHSAIDAYCC